jgi:hypothetical protein
VDAGELRPHAAPILTGEPLALTTSRVLHADRDDDLILINIQFEWGAGAGRTAL